MAHIWVTDDTAAWKPAGLSDEPLELGAGGAGGVCVCRAHTASPVETWVLVSSGHRGVRVNGRLLQTGIRELADRDEIKVGSEHPVFFSTEELARVEIFKAGNREIKCPRCKKPIQNGAPVVRCPVCKLAYHHSTEKSRDCWGYSPTCGCGHSTSMSAGYRWTPIEMWE